MTVLEKDIEAKLRHAVERTGGLCLKWTCPGWAGVPDRICLLPGGRIVFVEMKREGGKVSNRQAWWKVKLERLGFKHYFIWDDEGVRQFRLAELRKRTGGLV